MVTTSVPDASGKDVDAAAGKASATNVDLYRTHLHLRGAPGAGRRGSVLRAVRRKSSAMTQGGSSILRNLQRMGSVKSRLAKGTNSFTGSDAHAARAMGEIQTLVMAQQDALGQRMALLETTLDDIKQMMAEGMGRRGSGHAHHTRRVSAHSLAHEGYPSIHSIDPGGVRDPRRGRGHSHGRVTLSRSGTRGHHRGHSNGGSRAPTRGGSLHIDTASLAGVSDDFRGRSPVVSAGGRSSGGRRASFSALPTVTPRVDRDELRERLNRSHEVSAVHLG